MLSSYRLDSTYNVVPVCHNVNYEKLAKVASLLSIAITIVALLAASYTLKSAQSTGKVVSLLHADVVHS